MNWLEHLSDAERRLAAWLRFCLTIDRTADSVPANFIPRWEVDDRIAELELPRAATIAKFVHLGLIADDFPDVWTDNGKREPLACSSYKILGAVLCVPSTEADSNADDLKPQAGNRMDAAALAMKYGLPKESLRKALERFRANNPSCYEPVQNRTKNTAEFVYFESAVEDVIRKQLKLADKNVRRSVRRKKSSN